MSKRKQIIILCSLILLTFLIIISYTAWEKNSAFDDYISEARQTCEKYGIENLNLNIVYKYKYDGYNIYNLCVDGTFEDVELANIYQCIKELDSLYLDYRSSAVLLEVKFNGNEYKIDVLNENELKCNETVVYTEGENSRTSTPIKQFDYMVPTVGGEPTMGEQKALEKAYDYLEYTAFSYTGLIEQLEFEGFSNSEATYAADNCGADWNEQAALKAQQYLEYSSFSRSGLIEQLEFEGFTHSQAEYGVTENGY